MANFDGVFESVKETLGAVASTVAEKSVELKDSAKVKYKIYELKSDVKKLYFEIGKLTYGAAANGADNSEDLKQMCATVTEKLAKIEQLENGVGDVEFRCPNCGMTTSGLHYNCPNCGSDMTEEIDD